MATLFIARQRFNGVVRGSTNDFQSWDPGSVKRDDGGWWNSLNGFVEVPAGTYRVNAAVIAVAADVTAASGFYLDIRHQDFTLGSTIVSYGRDYDVAGVAQPQRSISWVITPEHLSAVSIGFLYNSTANRDFHVELQVEAI